MKPPKKRPIVPRRARGTGALFWSKRHQCWIGRVLVSSANGKPIYRERRGKTQAELLGKLKVVQPPGPSITVAEWSERWFAALAVRPSTRNNHRAVLANHVIPAWGNLRLADITSHHIERAMQDWGRTQNPNTVKSTLGVVKYIFESARKAKVIPENPAALIRPPRAQKVLVDPFTPEELARIVAQGGIWSVLASLGCRCGEALALEVSDFNPATETLSITKTFSRTHGMRRPKSENGIRTVTVPSQAVGAVVVAAGRRKTGALFRNLNGVRSHHGTIRAAWVRLLRKLGIRFRRLHMLRHSVASLLVNRGVPLADAAAFLGDSVQTLLKNYVRPLGYDVSGALETAFGGRVKSRTRAAGS